MAISLEGFALMIVFIALICLALAVIYLYISTTVYPHVGRHDSEKFFFDPKSKSKRLFPDYTEHSTLDITIVVPAYNEEERLPVMMDEAMEYLEKRQAEEESFAYEVIIVDDGSKDKTSRVGLKYSELYGTEKVRVLTLQHNRGKGGALRLGMLSGRGKQLLLVDADGATKFSDLDKLDSKMKSLQSEDGSESSKKNSGKKSKNPLAIVCGSRAHMEKESISERSFFRTVLMYGFHFLVWFLCVRGIKDTQCGFKLLTRQAAMLLFLNLHVERWAFDVDLLYLAQHFGIPIAEVAVNWQEIEGTKMVPVWSWLQMGRDIVLIRLRYTLGIWKVKTKF